MQITVILCTYNRCNSLTKTLDSIAASSVPPPIQWEVLVVDNNSNDQTRAVVEEFCIRYRGRFRYLFEPRPGKSYALNSGVHEAGGKILVFTDDDVTVEPEWLQNLTAALEDQPWAGAGGRIVPEWFRPVPRWLDPRAWYASGPLVQFDLGDKAGELSEPPFGANMAFRKEMFEKHGGFRTDLGPRPESKDPQKGEDSEFGHRILAAGEQLRYEPLALVYHPVQQNRITKEYFQAWWFDKGRSDVRVHGLRPGTRYFVSGIPLYMFPSLLVWTLRWMLAFGPSKRFSNKLVVWMKIGEILEAYRGRLAPNRG